MAKENKVLQAFRLQGITIEVIRDVVDNGIIRYGGDDLSHRVFLEMIMSRFVYDALMAESELKPMQNIFKSYINSHKNLCQLFLKYRRAKRGEKGYKLHRRTEKDGTKHIGEIVWISGPEDNK